MICWVDTETSGLEPREGALLEVALVVTDDELVEQTSVSVVVAPVGGSIDEIKMDDVVYRMHVTNGLIAEVRAHGERRYEAEAKLVEFALATCGGAEACKKIPLAGSTVGFDRRWLIEHMPRLEGLFSYRSVDASSFTEMAKRWSPAVYEGRPKAVNAAHRALADVRESIEILKYYKTAGFIVGEKR